MVEIVMNVIITPKDRLLSATGHTTGGLLVAAAINMHPELFRATILNVSFLDIYNTLLDPNLPLTVLDYEEFRNPQIKTDFDSIMKYSPYDNIRKHICYLAMLVTSSYYDSRTLGNKRLSFSMSKCYDATANASVDGPKVSVFDKKKQKLHIHLAVVLGTVGGVTIILIIVFVLVFFYTRRNKAKFELKESEQAGLQMKSLNAAKNFSYREINVASRNFKQALGRGCYGRVYLGKLPDGKEVAVKVWFDKTQLGADSFINERVTSASWRKFADPENKHTLTHTLKANNLNHKLNPEEGKLYTTRAITIHAPVPWFLRKIVGQDICHCVESTIVDAKIDQCNLPPGTSVYRNTWRTRSKSGSGVVPQHELLVKT
nr:probable LRR receptor-like serine/threonine-protein kinase At5g48740 [Tanacetum cinerariifolium]